MSFKIVETVEKGKPKLYIVPSQWETNSILRWPKDDATILMKDPTSVPDSDWFYTKCELKKTSLSYERAQNVLRVLENTEDDCPVANLIKEVKQEILGPQSPETYYIADSNFTEEQLNPNITNIEKILLSQKQLLDNQKLLLENQKSIMRTLNNFSVKLNSISMICKRNRSQTSTPSNSTHSNNCLANFEPIKSLEELDEFEKLLNDNNVFTELKEKFSVVCSRGIGFNCAYTLSDVLFSREFLATCSWTGGSRSEESKVPLKVYKNTLRFFFEMVHSWDPNYTMQDNDIFFKRILRNATKRKLVKFTRMSSSKVRRKTCKKRKMDVDDLINTLQKQQEQQKEQEQQQQQKQQQQEQRQSDGEEEDESLC